MTDIVAEKNERIMRQAKRIEELDAERLAALDEASRLRALVEEMGKALEAYHTALKNREHGGVAGSRLIYAFEATLTKAKEQS